MRNGADSTDAACSRRHPFEQRVDADNFHLMAVMITSSVLRCVVYKKNNSKEYTEENTILTDERYSMISSILPHSWLSYQQLPMPPRGHFLD